MRSEVKFFLGVIVATIVIIGGGILLFNKSSSNTNTSSQKVDTFVLIHDDSHKLSSSSASVTLVEFADFQCPACGAYYPVVKKLMDDFKGKLNFVHRNFPLDIHKNSHIAAEAAEAAGLQGKFWEMYDKLFENQNEWSDSNNPQDIFINYAKSFSLDIDRFGKDLVSQEIKRKIDKDTNDGYTLGVNSTPTFYLDSEKIQNPTSFVDFQTLIKAAILKAPVIQNQNEAYHIHSDFKVYINGKSLDFSLAKYQSKEGKELNPYIHLHDGNGNVIHVHKKGIKLGDFFNSLGFKFSSDCLVLDTGIKYCSDTENKLQLFVNGKQNSLFDKYELQDLDRILITYGQTSNTVLQNQISSVADTACIYSLTCPQRGKPPTESCVGGLGTGCRD